MIEDCFKALVALVFMFLSWFFTLAVLTLMARVNYEMAAWWWNAFDVYFNWF